jgi:hypothetical protein
MPDSERGFTVLNGPSIRQIEKILFDRFPFKDQIGGDRERLATFFIAPRSSNIAYKGEGVLVRITGMATPDVDNDFVVLEGEVINAHHDVMKKYFMSGYHPNGRWGWLEFREHSRDHVAN